MPVDTRIQVPFLPQTGITEQILAALQLANVHYQQQQQLKLQQQAQPSEIALRTAQAGQATAQAGLTGAETGKVQAETAALPALLKAQTDAAAAHAALEQTQTEFEKETNPLKKKQLEYQTKLQAIEVQRAETTLKFFGVGVPTAANKPGANVPSGFDSMVNGVRTTLGKLAPDEKAVLDAAETSSRYDAMNGRPDALNHVQQATEEIANNRRAKQVAALFGQARGDIYNKEYYNTENGQIEQLTANEFNAASKQAPHRYIQFTGTVQNTLKAQSLINDIQDGIDFMRKTVNDKKFELSAGGRALLFEAQKNPENFVNAVVSGAATGNLSQQEKNYFMAMATLNERAMAMRGLQGQGSGSDQQREAIVRMLPGLATADKKMAGQQLDLFQNNLDNLNKMVPKIGGTSKKSAGAAANAPTGGIDPAAAAYLQSIGVQPPPPPQ